MFQTLLLNNFLFGNNFFMKSQNVRFSVFCLLVALIVCVPISSPVFATDKDLDTTYFFCVNSIEKPLSDCNVIQNGGAYIVECKESNSKIVKHQLGNILGEGMIIKNLSQKSKSKVLAKYQNYVQMTETLDGYQILLCYDGSLPNFVTVQNIKINIQIAVSKDRITIGYPLILCGF